jgi:hypothetical protein
MLSEKISPAAAGEFGRQSLHSPILTQFNGNGMASAMDL